MQLLVFCIIDYTGKSNDMKKMLCNFCQETLEFENHKYTCPICDKEWNEIILSDKNYFDSDCVSYINPILTSEYQSFYSLLQNKQVYGIILQIKDIYEIIIRIPVLLVCSFILNAKHTLKGKELLVYMMSKPLSLGDWRYLVSLASEVVDEMEENVPIEIKSLVNIVKKFVFSDKNGDIVYWRNSTISHGATRQLNDADLYDDAATKLEEITGFFKNNASLFHSISFIDENGVELDENNSKICKRGRVFLKINDKKYSLYPFFTIKDEGIFLFDRYVKKIKKTDIIDYVKSVKTSVEFEELNNLSLENSISLFNADNSIDTYTIEERDLCEEIANGNEFLSPDYLIEALKEELKNKKSVFSIQMEKGMGKSYFVKGLDPFSLNNIFIDELTVKAFYINSTYNSRVNDFCICVEDLMRKKTSGFTIANSVIRLNINSADPSKAFADFLNEYKRKYYYDKKLLFIFDGIDELKIQTGKNITDFIPDYDDLDDGIYILLTLRTDSKNDEISPFVREYISDFKGKKYCYTKSSEEYLSFAKNYFDLFFVKKVLLFCKKNKLNNNINVAKMSEKFYEIEDKSMLNLSLIRELTLLNLNDCIKKGNDYFNADELSFGSDMYVSYFSSIKEYYGSKYYEKFVNVLCRLAIADRGLSLEELSVLSGNNNLNFAFLGFINSMKMFLDTIRDNKGTLFTIGHIDRKSIIYSIFKQEIDSLKNEIILKIENVSSDAFAYGNVEDNVFYCCINSILNDLNPAIPDDCAVAFDLFKSMLKLPLDFDWGAFRSTIISELIVLNNITGFEKFSFDLNEEQKYDYFMILSKIAFNEMILKNTCISEQFFEKAIAFYKDESADENKQNGYAETLSFYATLLWDLGENDKAYNIYKEVVKSKKNINLTDKQLVSDVDLLSEYVCLSNIANSARFYDEQFNNLKFVEQGLPLCCDCEKKERTLPFMSACFFSYYRDINDVKNAIYYINNAISEYDICCHNPESRMYIPDLVKCMYKYIDYINLNDAVTCDFDKEENYFNSLIDYISQNKDYDDPFSFMEYLFSLYRLYKTRNDEKAKYYKEKIINYYLRLDDAYKENERLAKIIEKVN